MRKAVIVTVALFLAPPAISAENVTISTAATSNGTLSGGLFTPTGDDAVLNVTDLQNALATSNVKIATGTAGTQTGNVTVATLTTWSAHTLTLSAHNSIILADILKATGTAGLTLKPMHGGDVVFSGGKVTFANTAESFVIGSTTYTLVGDIPTLATDISGNPSGNFALAANYDASTGMTFTHSPIPTTFTGTLEGLGNFISNLTILDTTAHEDVAMFAAVGTGGTIRDLGLRAVYVKNSATVSDVGGLVVLNDGLLTDDYVTGQIIQTSNGNVGGLASENGTGTIEKSFSSASMSAGATSSVGGLVGNNSGTIDNSYSTGSVSDSGSSSNVGGLAGVSFDGNISLSYSTGSVTSTSGNSSVGGFVGSAQGLIVGQSYATGDVSAGDNSGAGGFVGYSNGSISNCYARGDASAGINGEVGGFAGVEYSPAAIADSYSTGVPSGGSGTLIGGFIGYDTNGGLGNTYWNTTSSGVTNLSMGAGSPSNDSGVTGLTGAQLRSGLPTGFSGSIWAETTGINNQFPYLIALSP